jgi:hypothetical protein
MIEAAEVNAKRWIEAVTGLQFSHPSSFRESLKSGVLLCMYETPTQPCEIAVISTRFRLLNKLKPGALKIKNPAKFAPEMLGQVANVRLRENERFKIACARRVACRATRATNVGARTLTRL